MLDEPEVRYFEPGEIDRIRGGLAEHDKVHHSRNRRIQHEVDIGRVCRRDLCPPAEQPGWPAAAYTLKRGDLPLASVDW